MDSDPLKPKVTSLFFLLFLLLHLQTQKISVFSILNGKLSNKPIWIDFHLLLSFFFLFSEIISQYQDENAPFSVSC